MKTFHKYLFAAAAVLVLAMPGASAAKPVNIKIPPAKKLVKEGNVALADPFIMLYKGMYYAYGTNARDGIAVYVSKDLEVWMRAEGNAKEGLALHRDDVWGEEKFWAPEVYNLNGRFYMFYSAETKVCVATSDSPLGPFVQEVKGPMIDEKTIDNSLFIDDDGRKYMYFDRFNDGLNVWVVELEDDLKTVKPGTMTKCINVSQDWERVQPRVNEGPFVIKHKGTYYMTYSANGYQSQFYGIGCATAQSPCGPWTKYDDNPVLQNPGELVGVGHHAVFRDKRGRLKVVFHAHNSKEKVHPRLMYITDLTFTKEGDGWALGIAPDYDTPYYYSVVSEE